MQRTPQVLGNIFQNPPSGLGIPTGFGLSHYGVLKIA